MRRGYVSTYLIANIRCRKSPGAPPPQSSTGLPRSVHTLRGACLSSPPRQHQPRPSASSILPSRYKPPGWRFRRYSSTRSPPPPRSTTARPSGRAPPLAYKQVLSSEEKEEYDSRVTVVNAEEVSPRRAFRRAFPAACRSHRRALAGDALRRA
ncbi:hypothetical protein B0H12DRAFT_828588 [Mycena haematopus]|nr:hypothetical protein B0H12DRAFT_828588 [Mycena haematopus]